MTDWDADKGNDCVTECDLMQLYIVSIILLLRTWPLNGKLETDGHNEADRLVFLLKKKKDMLDIFMDVFFEIVTAFRLSFFALEKLPSFVFKTTEG